MPTKHTLSSANKRIKKSSRKTKKVVRKSVKKATRLVASTPASMSKKKAHQNWIDTIIALGLLALAIEMAGLIWIGPGLTASVYNPLQQTESQLNESKDTSGIKSQKFSACERRAMKIRNQKRREQVLTICSQRKRGAAPSSAASSSSAPVLVDENNNVLVSPGN